MKACVDLDRAVVAKVIATPWTFFPELLEASRLCCSISAELNLTCGGIVSLHPYTSHALDIGMKYAVKLHKPCVAAPI